VNVEFLMAARQRLAYQGQKTLTGSLLDKPDKDALIVTLEDASQRLRGNANKTALDAVEILIAEQVDAGELLPITNSEGFQAAQWLSQAPLSSLPDPIPRPFVLYLAKAWADAGKYPSLKAAITDILNTRTFA
jgi:hypothetical protein